MLPVHAERKQRSDEYHGCCGPIERLREKAVRWRDRRPARIALRKLLPGIGDGGLAKVGERIAQAPQFRRADQAGAKMLMHNIRLGLQVIRIIPRLAFLPD